MRSFALLTAMAFASGSAVVGQEKTTALTDQQFGRTLTAFLEEPLAEKSKESAKQIVQFTMDTPDAAVMLGENELKWIGKKEDDRTALLFAAYLGGNVRSQLLSGVKHNDRYSGLLTLFSVYKQVQAKDKDFKIAEVDELRKLHAEGKLLAHVVEMEKAMPTKLSPEAEKALESLRKK